MNIVQKPSESSAVATVEFEVPEDVNTAKVRNGKELNGREVHIQSGSRSTLYVANYPAEYDEATVRKLFESYGEVVNVRFPSLKYNSRRRFCYVQFLTAEQAQAAENAMNDKMLDGHHRLLAKIADPEAKKNRSGAQAEGREIFVKNLENSADEGEIKQLFSQFGNVVSMNLLKRANGVRLGNGFVVFSSADEATKAVEQANNKPFYDRILNVEFSTLVVEMLPRIKPARPILLSSTTRLLSHQRMVTTTAAVPTSRWHRRLTPPAAKRWPRLSVNERLLF